MIWSTTWRSVMNGSSKSLVSSQELVGRLILSVTQTLMLDSLPRWDLMLGSLPDLIIKIRKRGSMKNLWNMFRCQIKIA
jgi:hypothetical protein